jgi:hypothetical protein
MAEQDHRYNLSMIDNSGEDKPEGEQEVGELGKEGRELLLQSARIVEDRGVEKSCTIEIGSTGKKGTNGQRRCIIDGGTWKGCDVSDFGTKKETRADSLAYIGRAYSC